MVIYLTLHWSKLVKMLLGVNYKIITKKRELGIKEIMKNKLSYVY